MLDNCLFCIFEIFLVACRSSGFCNRLIAAASPAAVNLTSVNHAPQSSVLISSRQFTSLTGSLLAVQHTMLASNPRILQFAAPKVELQQQARNLTKFSIRNGKRKSVKCILQRFKRLHWGGWIRTRCGRNKKIFKKSQNRRRRLRQHVLVNSTQAWLLDSMVGPYWRKPRHYLNDPYAPYHEREFGPARRKPIENWPSKEEYQRLNKPNNHYEKKGAI